MSMAEKSFMGRGWKFPPEFDKATQSVAMVSNEEDIEESLKIILSTIPGERVMEPRFGCDMHAHVFDVLDNSLKHVIKKEIRRSLMYFESRIKVESIDLKVADAAQGKLNVDISYLIKQSNSRRNLVFPFYLNEGTDIRI